MDILTVIRYKAEIEDAFKENLEAVSFSFRSRRVRDELLAELDDWLVHHDFTVRLQTEALGTDKRHVLIVESNGYVPDE